MFDLALSRAPELTPAILFVLLISSGIILVGLSGIAWVLWRGNYALPDQPFRLIKAIACLLVAFLAAVLLVRMFATLAGVPMWLISTNISFIQVILILLFGHIFGATLAITLFTYSSLLAFWPCRYIWMLASISGAFAWAYCLLVAFV